MSESGFVLDETPEAPKVVVASGTIPKQQFDDDQLREQMIASIRPVLTVKEMIYIRTAPNVEQQLPVEHIFQRELKTVGEQPYSRKDPNGVGEEWELLNTGWIKSLGMLVIKNEEGVVQYRIPTEEQKAELAKKVIEIGLGVLGNVDVFAYIPPKESCRFAPVGNLFIRCRSGRAKYTLVAFPD